MLNSDLLIDDSCTKQHMDYNVMMMSLIMISLIMMSLIMMSLIMMSNVICIICYSYNEYLSIYCDTVINAELKLVGHY